MKIGSLFSGIGGLELGLEWAGVGHTVWQVEKDAWCRGVLAKHWPNVKRYNDVRTVGRDTLEWVDVICGGFPCQDISVAGKGAGIEGARSGLWREYARIIGEIRPSVVIIENVAALVTRGLDVVVADLGAAGYRVDARIIAAADVGAPHMRERLFVVGVLADTHGARLEGRNERESQDAVASRRDPYVNDGTARGGQAESRMGRGAHGPANRVDRWPARPGDAPDVWEPSRSRRVNTPTTGRRLRALGNGCVPQCLVEVGLFALMRLAQSSPG